MRNHRPPSLLPALILLSLALSTTGAGGMRSAAAARIAEPESGGPWVARVYYDAIDDLRRLAAYDLLEANNREEQYVLAIVDAGDLAGLAALGFRAEVDAGQTASLNAPRPVDPNQAGADTIGADTIGSIPGFPCYRTVEETFASAAALAAAHPNLAAWIDVGDSWEKSVGRADGYDMMVLVLTNSAIPGPKPRLFVTASIHAREYAPAELAMRFGETLVHNYGIDADATWLLDHHEIHLMPQANPDGRKEAETGALWRKNTNEAYCGAASRSRGADLNRNFDFEWGLWAGSSGAECGSTPPPNAAGLQTLGRKLAAFNRYTPAQAVALYPTDGSTSDYGYGRLGVASYTFEMGATFFQDCATFESTIYPANLDALVYAARAARTPYLTPGGPDALDLAISPARLKVGQAAVLRATIDDTRYRNTAGAEPSQPIAAAEFTIDTPPWAAGAAASAMAPADGSLDSPAEHVAAAVDTSDLAPGRHILYVRGQDASGAWGAVSAVFLEVASTDAEFLLYVPCIQTEPAP